MRKAIMAAFAVAVLALASAACTDVEGAEDNVLIDMGNGVTYWGNADISDPVGALISVAEMNGLDVSSSGSSVTSVGEMRNHSVGSQSCSWRLYSWDGSAWAAGNGGSAIAWGFYPSDSIVPAETPEYRSAWIMHRGDSASSGISDSYGTTKVATPLEWYRTYSTGYVDSAIVAAGNLLYHTTGGTYGATGSDKNPWVYCIDRFTGEKVWEYQMGYGQGYEVTSPLIVGDMLIVTATNGNVYCFDRFGNGAEDGYNEPIHVLTLKSDYPLDKDGNIAWDGRTFITGGTTPVYDSGAIYFGTADGHIMAYAVSRDDGFRMLWDYNPPATMSGDKYTGTKGCFYFHAPKIADIGGKRMLFLGSYEGYLYALDASTGGEIYVQRMINLGDENIPHRGTPGSVGSIDVTPDGRLIVGCSDGGMDPMTGFIMCVDASTGKGPGGQDWIWRIDTMVGVSACVDDGFYAIVGASAKGVSQLENADGTFSDIKDGAVYKFDYDGKALWSTKEYSRVKAALTLADGVLYMNDYSAGSFYPSGGAVTALSAEDGSELWRVKLSPYSESSFSMVSATVLDGKIYVGNDYGAIYCISDVAGKAYGDDGEIVLENGWYHWSWLILAIVVLGSFWFLIKYY